MREPQYPAERLAELAEAGRGPEEERVLARLPGDRSEREAELRAAREAIAALRSLREEEVPPADLVGAVAARLEARRWRRIFWRTLAAAAALLLAVGLGWRVLGGPPKQGKRPEAARVGKALARRGRGAPPGSPRPAEGSAPAAARPAARGLAEEEREKWAAVVFCRLASARMSAAVRLLKRRGAVAWPEVPPLNALGAPPEPPRAPKRQAKPAAPAPKQRRPLRFLLTTTPQGLASLRRALEGLGGEVLVRPTAAAGPLGFLVPPPKRAPEPALESPSQAAERRPAVAPPPPRAARPARSGAAPPREPCLVILAPR